MADVRPEGTHGFLTRRAFVGAFATSSAGALLSGCVPLRSLLPPAIGHHPQPKVVTPFVTPNEDFYMVAIDPTFRPPVSLETVSTGWALELVGLGGTSRRVGYEDLRQRANRVVPYTYECIGNPVGGRLIGNAMWQAIPLREVLSLAPGGLGAAQAVMFEALDGFYSSVSVQRATDDYAFLALGMNGVPLPLAHGFPARVILPDLYGKKQPRWLRRIALLEDPRTTSYWEKRGWAGEVPVKTMSRFDPRGDVSAGTPLELTGIAFAGRRGVRRVEISLDSGTGWIPCELVTGERPNVWSLWRYRWANPRPGTYTLRVRAIDGTGEAQTARRHGRFRSGATGHHNMRVRVAPV